MESKYFKYKLKYLNLKINKQTGGSEWFRHNPQTNKYQELSTVDRGVDIDAINAAINFVKLLEIPEDANRNEISEYIEDLPSGRKIKLTFLYHPDGIRIIKYEYLGGVVTCNLSNQLNKNRDFILASINFGKGGGNFDSRQDAITFISANFDIINSTFDKYKHKPTLEQVITYLNTLSDEEIQRIRS
jgi:hypothetical protein